MNTFNGWVTPETVLWVSAGVALVLLVCLRPVTEIWLSRRRDSSMRAMKVSVYMITALTVIFPSLVLLTGQTVKGTACGWYLLFFLFFWYYLGRNVGNARGRQDLSDLIGLEGTGSVEDAQDRLYESRLRLPGREAVAESIRRLSREQIAEAGETETAGDTTPESVVIDVLSVEDAALTGPDRR